MHSLLRATRASDRAVTEVGTSVRRHWEKGDCRAGTRGRREHKACGRKLPGAVHQIPNVAPWTMQWLGCCIC